MPLIQISLTGQPADPNAVRRLQQQTTHLMQTILHKEAAVTVVSVTQLPAGAFSAGSEPVTVGASLQAMITAGTNSEVDKAAFIFAANAMLTAAIGSTTAPIYVALLELPADSWGYDGQTQAARKAGRSGGVSV